LEARAKAIRQARSAPGPPTACPARAAAASFRLIVVSATCRTPFWNRAEMAARLDAARLRKD
jgi:hypothetical protein